MGQDHRPDAPGWAGWGGSPGEHLSSQHQGEQSWKGCLAPSAPLALRGVRALSVEGWSEGEEEAPNHGKHRAVGRGQDPPATDEPSPYLGPQGPSSLQLRPSSDSLLSITLLRSVSARDRVLPCHAVSAQYK